MNRRRAVIVVVVLAGAGLSLVPLGARWKSRPPAPPAPIEAPAPAPPQGPLPAPPPPRGDWQVFRDWIAVGSGCFATSSEPGDVTMERLTLKLRGREIHRARFHLDRFRFTEADRPKDEKVERFARECALRVQLATPPGGRLTNATAYTRVVSTKSPGLRLTLFGQLRLGSAPIGHELIVHEDTESFHDKLEVFQMSPRAQPEESLPPLTCGEPRLLGFDYTWIAEPTGEGGELAVSLGGDKVLDLDVEFSDCP